MFKKLQGLLSPLNIVRFYTDDWGDYERNIPQEEHEVDFLHLLPLSQVLTRVRRDVPNELNWVC